MTCLLSHGRANTQIRLYHQQCPVPKSEGHSKLGVARSGFPETCDTYQLPLEDIDMQRPSMLGMGLSPEAYWRGLNTITWQQTLTQ